MEREHPLGPEGRSDAAQRLRVLSRSFARSPYPALITGEIGTGKTRLARFLHSLAGPAGRPFLLLACGSDGAALDPVWSEVIAGATLLLSRVDEAPAKLQREIARALAHPKSGRGPGRVLATSRRELAVEVLEGRFLADLYFRLRVLSVDLPPLRDRREDIPVIARSLLEELVRAEARGDDVPEMTAEALEQAIRFRWPGNVRQLRNELARCVARGVRTIGKTLFAEGLDDRIPIQPVRSEAPLPGLRHRMDAYERSVLSEALALTQGNRQRAASLLGITRRTLQRKLHAARRCGAPIESPRAPRPFVRSESA